MRFTLTKEQEVIRDAAGDFLRAKFPSGAAPRTRATPPAEQVRLWQELAELGWTGLAIPEEHGGTGAGFVEACLLLEEIGAYQLSCPFLPSVVCAGITIDRFGTPEQRRQWLPAIAAGRVMTYVHGGTDRESPVLATECANGFVLNGTAWFVPYAGAGEEFLVIAHTGGTAELTAFVVDAQSAGIECDQLEVLGKDPQYRVHFAEVAVPGSWMLGEPAGGERVAEVLSAFGAAATCVEMVGGARRVLEMTVAYAHTRTQFGKPIGALQAVQQRCADMAVDLLGSRLVAYEAACRLAAGAGDGLAVAVAKAWVSETYQRICAHGHQVHGAIGFTDEHELHQYLRHALAGSVAFGDGDFHLEHVARTLGM